MVQARMKQRGVDAHVVVIVLANATVDDLKGKAPGMAALIKNLGMKALAALVVVKGVKPNTKGKKADLVLQVGVMWATK